MKNSAFTKNIDQMSTDEFSAFVRFERSIYGILLSNVEGATVAERERAIESMSYDDKVALALEHFSEEAINSINNSRGYNPNRDAKTGRFTFGTGAYNAATANDAEYNKLVGAYKSRYKGLDDGMAYYYAGNFDNMYINGTLHMQGLESGAESLKRPMERSSDGAKAPFEDVVSGIDGLIAQSTTLDDMTVSRKALLNKEVIDGMMNNKYLTYAGYTSVALTENHSRFASKDVRSLTGSVDDARATFANLGKDERMQAYISIKVPKGSNGLVVDALPNASKMLKESEYEMILPRDSSFNITNVKMEAADNFGYTRVEPVFFVEMELL